MEDKKLELQVLTEGIEYLQKALSCFVCSDNVTEEEYKKLMEFEDMLSERKTDLQIEIDGCIIEEA